MCSRNQWLCERDGNSRVHSVIFRSVGLRRTTRHQCTSMSFPLHNGALTKILDACSAPLSFQSNNHRFRILRSCERKCAGKEITTAGYDWTPVLPSWYRCSLCALLVTLASHLTVPPSDISDLSIPMEKAVADDCGANMSPES